LAPVREAQTKEGEAMKPAKAVLPSWKQRAVIGASALCGALSVLAVVFGWHAFTLGALGALIPQPALGLTDRIGGSLAAVASALLVHAWAYRLLHRVGAAPAPAERHAPSLPPRFLPWLPSSGVARSGGGPRVRRATEEVLRN